MLSEEAYLPESLHGFINDMKQQYTREIIEMKCKPVFQHEYALSKLRNQGYKIAVCSNSIRSTIENMMQKASLLQYLDLIMSNEDVQKAKPDPEIYVTAMQRLRLAPQECLVLEDNKNGIKAAVDSGAHLLRVNDIYDVNYLNIKGRIDEVER